MSNKTINQFSTDGLLTGTEFILGMSEGVTVKLVLDSIKNFILSGATSGSTSYWSASTGTNAIVVNNSDSVANGMLSLAEGYLTQAIGNYSHAEGFLTMASGTSSHAEGRQTIASGSNGAHAEGYATSAIGNLGAHAEGLSTTASGTSSHAEGRLTTASGNYSHAEGEATNAGGTSSHAEGYQTTAGGFASHAGGDKTSASGDYSFVHGQNSVAIGTSTIVLGGNITGNTNDTLYVNNISILSGATNGYVLTSDASGNGSWKPNYSSVSDLGFVITPKITAVITRDVLLPRDSFVSYPSPLAIATGFKITVPTTTTLTIT